MKKFLLGTAIVFAACAASIGSGAAATLEDVMARLDSLQRDNQAMRKEIAALRQNNAQAARHASAPAPIATPGRPLPAGASTAMAADIPARGYYKAAHHGPYDWSGFYAGLNAGYASGKVTNNVNFGIPEIGTSDYDGFFAGGQIGVSYQFRNLVVGVEVDFQFGEIGGAQTFNAGAPVSSTLDAFATARGRVGYAFDRFLPYVTAGFAAGRNRNDIITLPVHDTQVHTGWTAGAGLEYGIGNNWSVKAEYLHVDLGDRNYFPILAPVPATYTSTLTFDLVRTGVNYRF